MSELTIPASHVDRLMLCAFAAGYLLRLLHERMYPRKERPVTQESDFTWHGCPWCKGSVGLHRSEKRTAHTLPTCGGYDDYVASGKAKYDGYGLTSEPNGKESDERKWH
jgi:hypothetical protein